MLRPLNSNQRTRVIIPHFVQPQKFVSAGTFPHKEIDPQQNRGNWASPLTPNSGTSPVEPNHEATAKLQGEEHLEVQAPPLISTLPVEVVGAIGVILLILSCSLLVYKLIQDRRRQEPSVKAKTSINMDQNGAQGAKGRNVCQHGGTQNSISKPEVIHFGSHILKRDTCRSQNSFNNPDKKVFLQQHLSQSSSNCNDNMKHYLHPPRYEETQEIIESYCQNHNIDPQQISEVPINLGTPGFCSTRFRRSFVLNLNPYHHWERAMDLKQKEMNYFTLAMASPNSQFYNEKALSPIQAKTSEIYQGINMNENQVLRDNFLPTPQNKGSDIKTQNLQNDQQVPNEDIFLLENVEQKVDYVENNHKFLSMHSTYDVILNTCNQSRTTSKHKSIS